MPKLPRMAKAAPLTPRTLVDFKPGTLRGTAGWVRVGQTHGGLWWFLDPDDRPFFSTGVNAVNPTGRNDGRSPLAGPYSLATDEAYGREDPERFVSRSLERLRHWHFNTLGTGAAPAFFDRGIYYTDTLHFWKVAPDLAIKRGGARLPDVFNPAWSAACEARAAERCAPQQGNRWLIGYFTDHELGWAQPHPASSSGHLAGPTPAGLNLERPSLLQICLGLDPVFPAYHAAWEFALAAYAGELAALANAWEIELPNKEALRQFTLEDRPLLARRYQLDNARFSREFARRYFAICAAAIRKHDPGHLILGCRFARPPGAAIVAECVAPHVDVLSANDSHEAPARRIGEYWRATAMPILLGAFCWNGGDFTRLPPAPGWRSPTSIERMLARGRAALEALAMHPAVVGWAWERWSDLPGDEPPFGCGLVHLNDREAREHTELLALLNAQAEPLRRVAGRHAARR